MLEVAADRVDDEEIAAEAIKIILIAPVEGDPTDLQISKVRELQERYFVAHPDTTELIRVQVGNDFSELTEMLRHHFENTEASLSELTSKVLLGQYPLAVISDSMRRGYAELLTKRALGCYVISGDGAETNRAREAVKTALETGEAVADTSALVVGPKLLGSRNELLANFSRVHFPVSLRSDVDQAVSSLSLRSTATMGWDPQAGRPTLTEYPDSAADAWANEVQELSSDLRLVSVMDDADDPTRGLWNASILLAQRLGKPLWADDVALRRVAGELGVNAFGTLDLIAVLRQNGASGVKSQAEVLRSIRENRIVDIPFDAAWAEATDESPWSSAGYGALVLSRPASWSDLEKAMGSYQALIRARPAAATPQEVATFAGAACRGLALSIPSSVRPRVVGTLLAWTALNTEPMLRLDRVLRPSSQAEEQSIFLQELFHVGEALQTSLFESGDAVANMIDAMSRALLTGLETATVSRLLVTAFSAIPDAELRSRSLTQFLSAPPTRDGQ